MHASGNLVRSRSSRLASQARILDASARRRRAGRTLPKLADNPRNRDAPSRTTRTRPDNLSAWVEFINHYLVTSCVKPGSWRTRGQARLRRVRVLGLLQSHLLDCELSRNRPTWGTYTGKHHWLTHRRNLLRVIPLDRHNLPILLPKYPLIHAPGNLIQSRTDAA